MGIFGRRKTALGLDVGSAWTKLVEVDHGGARPEVVGVAAARAPAGAVVDGEIADPDLVTESVRELVALAGASGPDVVLAMGGHDVFVKKAEVERAKGAALRGAVQELAERHVPFDLASVELDYHVLDPIGNGGRVEVLLVAAKKDAVAAKVEAVAATGLNPVLVDVETFALHNAFTCNHGGSGEGTVALVNVRRDSATVNVLEDDLPLVARDLPVGAGGWPNALDNESSPLAGALDNESSPLAGALDNESSPLAGAPHPATEEAAAKLADAVGRTSAFLAARRSPTGLGQVFLSGSGACVPGLAESLARRIGVETRLANPFERVPVRSGARCRGVSLNAAAPMLMLALGLALRTP